MNSVTRRSLLRSAGAVTVAALAAGGATAQEPKPAEKFKTQLGKAKVLTPTVLEPGDLPVNVSPDGLATSIILTPKLDVSLGADPRAYSTTRVAVLEIPVTLGDMKEETFLGYHALLTGEVRKGEGTRVLLTLDLGGTQHTVEYPFGTTADGPIKPEVFFGYSPAELKQVVGPDGERTLVGVPAPPHYTAVLLVGIQRRTLKDEAEVTINGLDVEIIRPRKGPAQPPKGREPKKGKR